MGRHEKKKIELEGVNAWKNCLTLSVGNKKNNAVIDELKTKEKTNEKYYVYII